MRKLTIKKKLKTRALALIKQLEIGSWRNQELKKLKVTGLEKQRDKDLGNFNSLEFDKGSKWCY